MEFTNLPENISTFFLTLPSKTSNIGSMIADDLVTENGAPTQTGLLRFLSVFLALKRKKIKCKLPWEQHVSGNDF